MTVQKGGHREEKEKEAHEMSTYLSLGAGVQSSTLALMCAAGEIVPMPDAAIFADTQAEPRAVYDWLTWLETQLPFPVYRVTSGSLADEIGRRTPNGQWANVPIPAFIGVAGGKGAPINKSCTREFKLKPMRRKVRQLCGLYRKRSPSVAVVTKYIGISADEAARMRDSDEPWVKNRYPLVDLGMTRRDCLDWMASHGYPKPPKSACSFCPFHSSEQWWATRADPAAWAQAVAIDERIRDLWTDRGGQLFVHPSMRPLSEAIGPQQGDLFGNECEGMCGV